MKGVAKNEYKENGRKILYLKIKPSFIENADACSYIFNYLNIGTHSYTECEYEDILK